MLGRAVTCLLLQLWEIKLFLLYQKAIFSPYFTVDYVRIAIKPFQYS